MADEEISVCQVVNRVEEAPAAVDLAGALNEFTQVHSDIIEWAASDPSSVGDQIQIHTVTEKGKKRGLRPESFRKLSSIINEYDVITTHHTFAGICAAHTAKRLGVPIVAREGNDHSKFPLQVRLARVMTDRLASKIICVSESVHESYGWFNRGISDFKFDVITNGVDIAAVEDAAKLDWSIYKETNISTDMPLIGTVGRTVEQKNHETLIRTIEHLATEYSIDVELVIVGSGEQLEFLREIARDHHILNRVHFVGYLEREKVYRMLHELDCYAMPSRWEGFSAATLQAMAAGVPCVLSDIPSFRSQYSTDVAKFHETESKKELAERIHEMLQEGDEMAKLAYEYVYENHSIERMAKEYEKVYSGLNH